MPFRTTTQPLCIKPSYFNITLWYHPHLCVCVCVIVHAVNRIFFLSDFMNESHVPRMVPVEEQRLNKLG